jgi:hypothetical protein
MIFALILFSSQKLIFHIKVPYLTGLSPSRHRFAIKTRSRIWPSEQLSELNPAEYTIALYTTQIKQKNQIISTLRPFWRSGAPTKFGYLAKS